MLLKKWKEKLTGSIKKLSGRKDFLEAVCAACALVAAADGEISDDEIKAATKSVSSNPTLTSAFKPGDIDKTIDSMLKRAGSGRTGRMGLYKEIEDLAGDLEMGEMVYLVALDVAEGGGSIGDKEKEVLTNIAKKFGINEKAMQV